MNVHCIGSIPLPIHGSLLPTVNMTNTQGKFLLPGQIVSVQIRGNTLEGIIDRVRSIPIPSRYRVSILDTGDSYNVSESMITPRDTLHRRLSQDFSTEMDVNSNWVSYCIIPSPLHFSYSIYFKLCLVIRLYSLSLIFYITVYSPTYCYDYFSASPYWYIPESTCHRSFTTSHPNGNKSVYDSCAFCQHSFF